ncbi:MAG: hypothetical protein D8M59_00160 [Planctomycetes bacterium]|nr:hypothetical protein [Planctomycetota bacterium]
MTNRADSEHTMPQLTTHTSDSRNAASAVRLLLDSLEKRARVGHWITTTAWIISGVLVLSAVLITIDAVYALDPTRRIAGLALYPVVIGFLLMRVGRATPGSHAQSQPGRNRRHFARAAEVASDLHGNELINAVLLSATGDRTRSDGHPHHVLTASLLDRALVLGDQAAGAVSPQEVVPRHEMRTALLALAVVSAIAALLCAPFHQAVGMVVPRLAAPWAGYPAFTWLDFEIETTPGPDDALVGDDVLITATIRNTCWWNRSNIPAASAVRLLRWQPDQSGGDPVLSPIPFEPAPRIASEALPGGVGGTGDPSDDRFCVTLHNVRQPLTLAVDTPIGRSQAVTLTPRPVPRIQSANVRVQEPAYVPATYRHTTANKDLGQRINMYPEGSVQVQIRASMADCRLELTRNRPAWSSGPDLEWVHARSGPDATDLTASCCPTEPGHYEYQIRLLHEHRDSGGSLRTVSSQPLMMRLSVIPDQKPMAEILIPDRPAMCLPDQPVSIRVRVADDIGLSSVSVSAQRIPADPEDDGQRHNYRFSLERAEAALPPVTLHSWDLDDQNRLGFADDCTLRLADLGVQPGDIVACRVVAQDDHPDVTSHTTESRPAYLLIIDPAVYQDLVESVQGNRQSDASAAATGDDAGQDTTSDPDSDDTQTEDSGETGSESDAEQPAETPTDGEAATDGETADGTQQQPGQQARGEQQASSQAAGGPSPDLDGLLAGRGLYGLDSWPIQQQQTSIPPDTLQETREASANRDPERPPPAASQAEADVPTVTQGVLVTTDPLDSATWNPTTPGPEQLTLLSPTSAASLRMVPLPYRDLASRYLLRLLQDEYARRAPAEEGTP